MTGTRASSRSPSRPSSKSKAALEQGELALAQLERDRDTMATARDRRAEAEAILAERRSMLEKARQAERLAAERDAATERYERYTQAVDVDAEIHALATTHPSANPLPACCAAASSDCAPSTRRSAS